MLFIEKVAIIITVSVYNIHTNFNPAIQKNMRPEFLDNRERMPY